MLPVKTIEWMGDASGVSSASGVARIIDQTLLPTELRYLDIATAPEMWEAISLLRVRGAPAIGIAAAFGLYLGVRHSQAKNFAEFKAEVDTAAAYLAASRPTAVNLFWALNRLQTLVMDNPAQDVPALKALLLQQAIHMIDEDNAVCMKLGEYGASLIKDGDSWLTHCNAGGLATAQWGTALAAFYVANNAGKRIHVFADETRPLLQGARLTAWELHHAGIPVTVISDNMAASVMAQGKVQGVIVGTDRVAANGDFANKIGTLGVAILAKEFGIPFYVSTPISSIDMTLASGDLIPIEERKPIEITNGFGKQTVPDGVAVYNPAFDVTPHKYVTGGFITERGIVKSPKEL